MNELIQLDEHLEEIGWDQPARLLILPGFPGFAANVKVLAELEGHPCTVLQDLWRKGVRVDEGATGLALVVEGVRHLRIEEVRERAPEQYEHLVEIAADHLTEEMDEPTGDYDQIQTIVETSWMATIADTSPLSMPPALKQRVRNTILVMHTGWTLGVVRDFGGQPEELDPVPPQRLTLSRVPHQMWQFLVRQEPTD